MGQQPDGGYNNNPNGPAYPNGNPPQRRRLPHSAASSYRALTPQDATALVQTVQQRISEVSKLSAAKDGLDQRSLRADDLTRLLRSCAQKPAGLTWPNSPIRTSATRKILTACMMPSKPRTACGRGTGRESAVVAVAGCWLTSREATARW